MGTRKQKKKNFQRLAVAALAIPAVALVSTETNTVEAADANFKKVSDLPVGTKVLLYGIEYFYLGKTSDGNYKLMTVDSKGSPAYGSDPKTGNSEFSLGAGLGHFLNTNFYNTLQVSTKSIIIPTLWNVGSDKAESSVQVLANVGAFTASEARGVYNKYTSSGVGTLTTSSADPKSVLRVTGVTKNSAGSNSQPIIIISKDVVYTPSNNNIVINVKPTVSTAITSKTVKTTENDLVIDLANHFKDGNDENLTYTIEDLDLSGIAEFTVSGNRYLTIKAKGDGKTQVQVTGTDTLGYSVKQTFDLTSIGSPPTFESVVRQSIGGKSRLAVDVNYKDTASTKIPLIVTSSNEGSVKATFNKTTKMIDLSSTGKGVSRIHYYAEGFPELVKTFSVEVTNSAPVITDTEVFPTEIGVTKTITLPVTDVDGDVLDVYIPQSSGKKGYDVKQVGNNKLEVTVYAKGITSIPYTVTDDDGASVTGHLKMSVPNALPLITTVNVPKVNFVDPYSSVEITGEFTESDGEALTPIVEFNQRIFKGAVDTKTVSIRGNGLPEGITKSPLSFYVNDSHDDSLPWEINEVAIINVDNVGEYKKLLAAHDDKYVNYSIPEHEAFYSAYVAVNNFLSSVNDANYTDAMKKIAQLEESTISNTDQVNAWREAISLRATTSALGKAETALDRTAYELAQKYNLGLKEVANKTKFEARFAELGKYLNTSDKLVPLEVEVARHLADPTTPLDETIINAKVIGDMQLFISATKDTIQGDYRTKLQDRFDAIKSHYFNESDAKGQIDYQDLYPQVETNPELESEYKELVPLFQPVTDNYPVMVKYADALNNFFNELDKPSYDAYLKVVTDNGLSNVSDITRIVTDSYNYRTKLVDNVPAINSLNKKISELKDLASIADTATKVVSALGSVTSYNQVDIDGGQSAEKLSTATTNVAALEEGQLKQDMNKYLTNSIPVIVLESDPYQFISDKELIINGSITDNNHSTTTVTVALGSQKETVQSSGNRFSTTFNVGNEGYVHDELVLTVSDGVISKTVKPDGAPMVITSKPKLYKEFVKLLEQDTNSSIMDMDSVTLNELLYIVNTFDAISPNTTQAKLDSLYKDVEELTGQSEGLLEQRVKSSVKATINTIFENFNDATVQDFNDIGLLDISEDNIDGLKAVIRDYAKTSDEPPTLKDYENWLELTDIYESLLTEYKDVYIDTDFNTIILTLEDIDNRVNHQIPSWFSGLSELRVSSKEMHKYETAVGLTENALKQNTLKSITDAKKSIDSVVDVASKERLHESLESASNIVEAETAVTDAESSKYIEDYNTAKGLVENLPASQSKAKLKDRLAYLETYFNALDKINALEANPTPDNLAEATYALDALTPDDRSDLVDRVDEVRDSIEVKEKEVEATKLVDKALESLTDYDYNKAMTQVNTLPNSKAKDTLVNKLKDVAQQISKLKEAEYSVQLAEELKTADAVSKAQASINLVVNYTLQAEFQARLDALTVYTQAESKVVAAETNLTDYDYNVAKELVSKLPEGSYKNNLNNRLDNVAVKIDSELSKEIVDNAIAGITGIPNQQEINNLQNLYNSLPDGTDKDRLEQLLKSLQDLLNKLNNLEKLVSDAQKSGNQSDLDAAQYELDKLIQLAPDASNQLTLIQEKLNEVSVIVNVTNLIVKYEQTKDIIDFNNALDEINKLPEGEEKQALQDRLVNAKPVEPPVTEPEPEVTPPVTEPTEPPVTEPEVTPPVTEPEVEPEVTPPVTEPTEPEPEVTPPVVEPEPEVTPPVVEPPVTEPPVVEPPVIDVEQEFLDSILDGTPLTAQELADFSRETIMVEMIYKYIEELKLIEAADGEVTQADFANVVRLVNSFETARRSMHKTHIAEYQNELVVAHSAIKSQYPNPEVMFATANYISEKKDITELANTLADLLGKDVEEVKAELEQILNIKEPEVLTGSYTVNYVDSETGKVVHTETKDSSLGEISVATEAPIGYDLIDAHAVSLELTKETPNVSVEVLVQKSAEDVELVNIKYVLEDGTLVESTTTDTIDLVIPKAPTGYELVNESDLDGLVPNSGEVEFLVREVQVARAMMRMASLDLMFTATTVYDANQNPRQAYLYQAAQVGVQVMSAVTSGEISEIDNARTEVNELLNGDYKTTLLSLLGYTGSILEQASVVDLTIVTPNPIVTPPTGDGSITTPPDVTPPTEGNGEGGNTTPPTEGNEGGNTTPPTTGEGGNTTPPTTGGGNEVEGGNTTPPTTGDGNEGGNTTPPTTSPEGGNTTPPTTNPETGNAGTGTTPPTVDTNPTTPPSTGGGGSTTPPTVDPNPTTPPSTGGGSSNIGGGSNTVPGITGTPGQGDIGKGTIVQVQSGDLTGWTIEGKDGKEFDLTSDKLNVKLTLENPLEEYDNMKVFFKQVAKDQYQLVVTLDDKVITEYKSEVELANAEGFKYMHLINKGKAVAYPHSIKDGKFKFRVNGSGKIFNFTDKKVTFKDIDKYGADKGKIEEMASRLIIFGTNPGIFSPSNELTRAQFAALMSRALGLEPVTGLGKFTDTKGKWFEGDVNAMASEGLMSGVTANMFSPGSKVTRVQAINVLYKYLTIKEKQGLITLPKVDVNEIKFNDSQLVNSNSRKAVATLAELGIVLGNQDGFLQPDQNLTRAQFTNLMYRTLTLTGDM